MDDITAATALAVTTPVPLVVGSPWTDERTEILKTMWDQGFSGTQIATALNCDLTRSAIMGKIHRLGLPARKDCPSGRTHKAKTTRIVKKLAPEERKFRLPKAPELKASEKTDLDPDKSDFMVGLFSLKPSSCRYPLPSCESCGMHLFCGAKAAGDRSYCSRHSAICYRPARSREPRALYR